MKYIKGDIVYIKNYGQGTIIANQTDFEEINIPLGNRNYHYLIDFGTPRSATYYNTKGEEVQNTGMDTCRFFFEIEIEHLIKIQGYEIY